MLQLLPTPILLQINNFFHGKLLEVVGISSNALPMSKRTTKILFGG